MGKMKCCEYDLRVGSKKLLNEFLRSKFGGRGIIARVT
jgi:hypothetical protein